MPGVPVAQTAIENRPSDIAAAPSGVDALTLQISFEQESWVEVKDAAGKTIFAQLNAAGSKRSLTGNSPLSVVVGNANGVHISINDRAISLEPHTQFNVARLTLP
jgi:cytoskeleton protein RodZ